LVIIFLILYELSSSHKFVINCISICSAFESATKIGKSYESEEAENMLKRKISEISTLLTIFSELTDEQADNLLQFIITLDFPGQLESYLTSNLPLHTDRIFGLRDQENEWQKICKGKLIIFSSTHEESLCLINNGMAECSLTDVVEMIVSFYAHQGFSISFSYGASNIAREEYKSLLLRNESGTNQEKSITVTAHLKQFLISVDSN